MKELTEAERKKKIRQKELAIIKASNQMLDEAKESIMKHGNNLDDVSMDSVIKNIDIAKNENILMAKNYHSASEEDVNASKYVKPSKSTIKKYEERLKSRNLTDEQVHKKDFSEDVSLNYGNSSKSSIFDEDDDYDEEYEFENSNNKSKSNNNYVEDKNFDISDIPANIQYDIIPLPSNGQCYKHKKSRIPVGYLTASDENLITSPNLYRDGKVIDLILKRKILDKNINPEELCKGDRDAILLWLRATGYGVDFPVTVHDNELDTDYDVTVDLSTIETKEFDLVGDENGWFDYETKNGDKIKFSFLNRNDEIAVKDTLSVIAANARREKIIQESQDLMKEVKNDELLQQKDKTRLQNACAGLYKWGKTLTVLGGGETYGNQMTLTMALSIKSVNGNQDRDFINNYVENMRAQEAYDFRNYMTEHTPGMDFRIVVTRPESDGGGSFDTFLELDSLLFLRLPKVRK